MVDGDEPISHGICDPCKRSVLANPEQWPSVSAAVGKAGDERRQAMHKVLSADEDRAIEEVRLRISRGIVQARAHNAADFYNDDIYELHGETGTATRVRSCPREVPPLSYAHDAERQGRLLIVHPFRSAAVAYDIVEES